VSFLYCFDAAVGSGKTVCYLLPVVNYLLTQSVNRSFKCLIIAPSKDLCLQIDAVLNKLTFGTDLRHASIYGSNRRGFKQEHAQLCSDSFDIVISTPLRLIDHVTLARASTPSTRLFSNLCFLVVDEADKVVSDEKFKLLIHDIIADKETKSPAINNDDYYRARANDFLARDRV
jgi:superfamily II DNA/RNA helicase